MKHAFVSIGKQDAMILSTASARILFIFQLVPIHGIIRAIS
jgi:hypothetical protein